MKLKYDKEADAAYIYLKGNICAGEVKKTISTSENINLDFDKEQKLIGIEILNASKVMPKRIISESLLVSNR